MANVNAVELLRFFVQCGFILFNLSVVVYICRGRRSDSKLRSGFFVLFLAVTMADWINTVTVSFVMPANAPLRHSSLKVVKEKLDQVLGSGCSDPFCQGTSHRTEEEGVQLVFPVSGRRS